METANNTSYKKRYYSHSPKIKVIKSFKNDDFGYEPKKNNKPFHQINLLTSHNIKNSSNISNSTTNYYINNTNNICNNKSIFQSLNYVKFPSKDINKTSSNNQKCLMKSKNQKFFISKEGLFKMPNVNSINQSLYGLTNINSQSKKKQNSCNNNNNKCNNNNLSHNNINITSNNNTTTNLNNLGGISSINSNNNTKINYSNILLNSNINYLNFTGRGKIKTFSPQINKITNLKYCGEYCLSSHLSKKEHSKIKIDNNNNTTTATSTNNKQFFSSSNEDSSNINLNMNSTKTKRTSHHFKGHSFGVLNQKINESLKQPFNLNNHHLRTTTEINGNQNLNPTKNYASNSKKRGNSKPNTNCISSNTKTLQLKEKYKSTIKNRDNINTHPTAHGTLAGYRLNTEENVVPKTNKNIDNNIIINFNILKPNIILDHHQKVSSRKNKINSKLIQASSHNKSNNNMNNINNYINNSNNMNMNHLTTEASCGYGNSNFISGKVNNNTQFCSISKIKNNYRNFDANKEKKSKEITQIIKSIKQEIQTQKGIRYHQNGVSSNKKKWNNNEFHSQGNKNK